MSDTPSKDDPKGPFPPIAPENWRRAMLKLEKQFERASETNGMLGGMLIHSSIADREYVAALRKKEQSESFVYSSGPPYTPGGFCYDKQGNPLYTDTPTLDGNGKPIVDELGRAILCELPTFREVRVYCTPDKVPSRESLFKSAGDCLRTAPSEAVSWIPQDTLNAGEAVNRFGWRSKVDVNKVW